MSKGRYKTWIIFLLICVISQVLVETTPIAYQKITQAIETSQKEKAEKEMLEAEKAAEEAKKQEELNQIANEQQVEDTTNKNANKETQEKFDDAFGSMINILSAMLRYISVIVMVMGVFRMILAFAHEDFDTSTSAISTVVIGGIMFGFSLLVRFIN